MGLDIVREVRGAMTRFDVQTPEHVTRFSEGSCTYEQLAADMAQMGLDIKQVVVDDLRLNKKCICRCVHANEWGMSFLFDSKCKPTFASLLL